MEGQGKRKEVRDHGADCLHSMILRWTAKKGKVPFLPKCIELFLEEFNVIQMDWIVNEIILFFQVLQVFPATLSTGNSQSIHTFTAPSGEAHRVCRARRYWTSFNPLWLKGLRG